MSYICMQAHVGDNIMRLIDLEIKREAVRDKVNPITLTLTLTLTSATR